LGNTLFNIPFYLRRGAQPVGWRVCPTAHTLRNLTRRSCLNGATQERSEFCGAPRRRAPQVARLGFAAQNQRDAGSRVAFLLVSFLWRSKEKELARRCDQPASASKARVVARKGHNTPTKRLLTQTRRVNSLFSL
jgi:hypothetical protein